MIRKCAGKCPYCHCLLNIRIRVRAFDDSGWIVAWLCNCKPEEDGELDSLPVEQVDPA